MSKKIGYKVTDAKPSFLSMEEKGNVKVKELLTYTQEDIDSGAKGVTITKTMEERHKSNDDGPTSWEFEQHELPNVPICYVVHVPGVHPSSLMRPYKVPAQPQGTFKFTKNGRYSVMVNPMYWEDHVGVVNHGCDRKGHQHFPQIVTFQTALDKLVNPTIRDSRESWTFNDEFPLIVEISDDSVRIEGKDFGNYKVSAIPVEGAIRTLKKDKADMLEIVLSNSSMIISTLD